MEKTDEIWLPAIGFEGYVEVSNIGRVRTVDRVRIGIRSGRKNQQFKPGKLLTQVVHTTGYLVAVFVIGGVRKQVYVHRMVGLAFVPGDPSLSINHINGAKQDNRDENLEWLSLAANTKLQWKTGLADARGEKNGQSKLSAEKVLAIRRMLNSGASQTDIAIVADVSPSNISFIANGERWASLTIA